MKVIRIEIIDTGWLVTHGRRTKHYNDRDEAAEAVINLMKTGVI